ncbi:sugar transferase [Postechiella marina]|uniref:Sugar transferase n=1 Tax=Postechiella marina TaxID=943941 RepID=A0ABP8C1C6_9FLAO
MYKIVKRLFDFLAAVTALILLFPIFFIVFICLLISNNGKAFFFQKRPGLHGKIFSIIKFKSMNDKKDANGEFLPDNERITKLGLFVRNYSLDEIPQLINVIKGDMSIVGPRPLLPEYLQHYNSEQKKRHNVRPGITGWAQVKGRNSISWKQKFEYDVWYVNNISLLLDIKIILLTIKKIIIPEGVNNSDSTTMYPFIGENEQ